MGINESMADNWLVLWIHRTNYGKFGLLLSNKSSKGPSKTIHSNWRIKLISHHHKRIKLMVCRIFIIFKQHSRTTSSKNCWCLMRHYSISYLHRSSVPSNKKYTPADQCQRVGCFHYSWYIFLRLRMAYLWGIKSFGGWISYLIVFIPSRFRNFRLVILYWVP